MEDNESWDATRYDSGNLVRDRMVRISQRIGHSLPDVVAIPLRPIYRLIMNVKVIRDFLIKPYNLQECHKYWRTPPPVSSPLEYIRLGAEGSEYLLSLIKKYAGKEEIILEVGCNSGRNLNYLYGEGYKNLEGIEICTEAVELLKKTYYELGTNCQIHNMAIEDIIGTIPDNKYDIVYTLAVLEHLHTDSNWVFKEIARIAKKIIITIEDEVGVSCHTYSRNYKKIFEGLGMTQLMEYNCRKIVDLGGSYMARVFKHDGGKRHDSIS